MSTVKDLAQLGKLIAAQHGWAAAKAFKSYQMTDADRAALSRRAVDLLKVLPASGTAAMLSAALAVSLEGHLDAPVQIVAGTLTVEGVPVFSSSAPFDDAGWDGHVWVMAGPYVVDASIFRAAYSGTGPARLSKHVLSAFGPNKGLYVDHWKRTARQGLGYEPQHVLSAQDVNALMAKAYQLIAETQAT